MKKFISSLLVIFLLLLSSCGIKDGDYNVLAKAHVYNNSVLFNTTFEECNKPYRYLTFLSYKDYKINYVLAGDELYIDCENAWNDVTLGLSGQFVLENINKIKVNRAPIINLKVVGYSENGIYKKEIVPSNKKIVLDKKYSDLNENIYTGHEYKEFMSKTYWFEYTNTKLNDLEEGTKLSATYYEEDGITYIYAFYLRSYVNKVKYSSFKEKV